MRKGERGRKEEGKGKERGRTEERKGEERERGVVQPLIPRLLSMSSK